MSAVGVVADTGAGIQRFETEATSAAAVLRPAVEVAGRKRIDKNSFDGHWDFAVGVGGPLSISRKRWLR